MEDLVLFGGILEYLAKTLLFTRVDYTFLLLMHDE